MSRVRLAGMSVLAGALAFAGLVVAFGDSPISATPLTSLSIAILVFGNALFYLRPRSRVASVPEARRYWQPLATMSIAVATISLLMLAFPSIWLP